MKIEGKSGSVAADRRDDQGNGDACRKCQCGLIVRRAPVGEIEGNHAATL